MKGHLETMKPDPLPWEESAFVIADQETLTVGRKGYAVVIDRETGEIKKAGPRQKARLESMAGMMRDAARSVRPIPKPQPDPWKSGAFVLTSPGTLTILRAGYAVVIDRETGEVKRVVPEMGIPGEYSERASAAVGLLCATESLKSVGELRLQTARFLVSMTETVERTAHVTSAPWMGPAREELSGLAITGK